MNKMKQKRCACCGDDAGRWEQWHNQDTGFGICRKCVDWIMTRLVFGRPNPDGAPLEFCRTYGLPGQHYEARTHRLHGLDFAIVAEFPDTEEGTKDANAFMEAFNGVGVLEVADGRIILASNTDKAVGRILTVTRKEFGFSSTEPCTDANGSETPTSSGDGRPQD